MSFFSRDTRWRWNSFLPLPPVQHQLSSPWQRWSCILAGSSGVGMNEFSGKILSLTRVCGAWNASWPSWLWNFLFSWSNFTLPPHGLSTSLPIEDRKPKQIEAVANGSFQDLETPIPDTKTHFLLVNMMHDVSQAVPDEVIINLPSPTPMHHADHPSFLSMWSEKQYPGFSPHENWLGRLISSKEETHFPNSSSKPSLSPTNNHRVFSPSLFQRPQDHKPSQMARTKKLPISLAQ